jgi:magnesium chelatase subunit I
MNKPTTLGELRRSEYWHAQPRSVKDEMRENLICKVKRKVPMFPGIIGYEDSVLPQLANAILSRHNFILLGLRGQAKSRLLRALTGLLEEEIPVVAGCEINDNPCRPICRACRQKIHELGDQTPLTWLSSEQRFVEKLATPDVTIADMIGDVDPIKAARGAHDLSNELTIHFGLLPRANRGIFALNELPDLMGKIQVGLFNIMQEGDVQIKGYPIRLPLDVLLVFTANPEDYTARGKIITPLKDRIGSEIRTHYPLTLDDAIEITQQETWRERDGKADNLYLPSYIERIVETIAFVARDDKKIDQRSGVSQRLPISCMENVISNAERRAFTAKEKLIVPRVGDIQASLPSITGKFELEYEGELRGADRVAHDLIRTAVAQVFDEYFGGADVSRIVQWFDLGGSLKLSDTEPAKEVLKQLEGIQGLLELAQAAVKQHANAKEARASAAEFLLEGLYAHRWISRDEELGYVADPKKKRTPEHPDFPMRPAETSFN